jgi:hypothetical protein
MKKLLAFAFGALLTMVALPASAASPALLAQRHGGGHVRVFVSPGFWGWGWGWDYPGYYYYPGAYARYRVPGRFEVVKTDVSPEEARVYLDGRLIGTADDFDGWPDYLYLARGRYRVEFRLEGYESQTVDIDAQPGTKIDLTNKLRRTGGPAGSYDGPRIEHVQRFWGKRRNATSPMRPGGYGEDDRRYDRDRDRTTAQAAPYDDEDGDADMSTDGQSQGMAPPPRNVAPPSEDWRGGDRAPDATVRSTNDRVRLRLKVEPPDAAVYLDDRFIGTAEEVNSLDRGVAVTPGRHTVTISRPGFKERSRQIDVKAGDTPSLELSLEK